MKWSARSKQSEEPGAQDELARFEALVRRHAREIETFLLKLCGNRHDAEELAQDVFVKAFRKLDTLREPEAARRWLFTIAVHHFNDWISVRKRQLARQAVDLEHHEPAAGESDRPSERAMAHELSRLMIAAIVRLPERQRTVLLLFSAKGFDYQAIAQSLGITPEAAKMSLFHAREKLRRHIDRYLGPQGRPLP